MAEQERNDLANYMVEVRRKVSGTSQYKLIEEITKLYDITGTHSLNNSVCFFSIRGIPNSPHIEVREIGEDNYSIKVNLHAIHENKLAQLERRLFEVEQKRQVKLSLERTKNSGEK